MAGEPAAGVPFAAHVDLLLLFVSHRRQVVDHLQELLNAQRKPPAWLQDRPMLSRMIEDGFFRLSGATSDQLRLRGQLEAAHHASGFTPRRVAELHNDLIHPAEMMVRGFHCWNRTRWPGRNGRMRYAEMLFNVYLLRNLEFLSLRLFDDDSDRADERLARLQDVLDTLWQSSPDDQPVLVRDARWLIPLAQSPTTDDLAAYFEVAERVADSLPEADALEIQMAGVCMIAGHLRSQIRHYCLKDGVSIDDESVVRRTRTSNALDFALLIQGLVPMLRAYDGARESGEEARARRLAGAICQGISPDPEVFLNRVELLGPYSMIEHLFVAGGGDAPIDYTHAGRRHIRLLGEYSKLIERLSPPLHRDCASFRPVADRYSPYGAIFGTPSNLTEDMALKTLEADGVTRFSLEDVFADDNQDAGRLGWVGGWKQLPHVDREVQRLYAYPHAFAAEMFERIAHELEKCVDRGATAYRTGRLLLSSQDATGVDAAASTTAALPARHIASSDPAFVNAGKAEACDEPRLLRNRQEGYYIVSFATSGGWVAVSKDLLTELPGAGQDTRIVGLPPDAARGLALMCPGLVTEENAPA